MHTEPKIEIRDYSEAALRAAAELSADVVHLWWRSLAEPEATVQACLDLLSRDEHERSERFRVDDARKNFILTRAALRSLLAHYLQKRPQELVFGLTRYGKPFVDDPDARVRDVRFNVSHADGLALLGFTRRREMGVDVERARPELDTWKLADRFFSAHEREALKNLSGAELQSAFFRCWSRKEAYIKARGEGLSLPLSQFDVSIEPRESRALLATRPDANEAARWRVSDLAAPAEYAAAFAFSLTSEA